jgi:hypothetical protein
MATSTGAAAARGIETGFGLGLRFDQQQEAKRAATAQEARYAAADKRADEELGLRRSADQRAERRLVDAERRDANTRAQTGLETRRKELVDIGARATAAGEAAPAGVAEEYGQVSARLAGLRQQALDDASRLATGQVSLDQMTPAQLYRTVTLGTGMTMKDLQGMPKHSADLQAGMETGNQGLVLQAVNGLLEPSLRIGVGSPSPYGGTITRKEIIGLDPARDANGVDHPNKVIPRLRVYVQRPGDAGERYYDAPMTKDRSSNPDDVVSVLDIQKAMDWVGNLGTLTTALQDPRLQERLAQGQREAGPEVDKYFSEFNLAIKPGKKQVQRERVDLGGTMLEREVDPNTGKVISERSLPKTAAPSSAGQAGAADLKNRLELLENDYIDGLMDDDEYKRRRGDLISGIRSRPTVGAGAGGAATFSDQYNKDEAYKKQVDYWAELVAKGGTLPPRFAQSGAGKTMYSDIVQRVPQISGGSGEMLANQAQIAEGKAGARALGTRAANFGLAKAEAYEMADLVTETSKAVGRTDFIPINKAIIAYERNTGDPEVVQYGGALNSFINAYSRAVSPVGQPTVHDKQHAREMLEAAFSHDQVEAAIKQLKREMDAAGRSVGTVRTQQREALTGGLNVGGAAQPATPAAPASAAGAAGSQPAPAAAPAGKPAPPPVGTVMKGYRFKGGDPAVQANWERVQ